ncbi:cell division protein FtsW [Heyndrickxia shackletonii]|uniref:Cell division protein FtsW n=1 Tax=Heyndrickxia shackletonii TaxID=157838 RepID=A0A0Q3WW72_9BACI|nr:FtsW/RodA/SpoVE family cell cycle protein [Heyndrickxia shackletonii]KQL53156.1 cell division protein FtsW [Heyndrickxia shackletonii]NEZ00659.1 rod shape-determining protein RodA [Heyndrickxia shackletonii]
MKTENEFLKRLDPTILFIIFLFAILSIVFIHSSQQTGQYGNDNFALKQGINYLIGFFLLFFMAYLDPDQIQKLGWHLYIIGFLSIIILALPLPDSIAHPILGAKRWYQIPFLGSIQPSEFFKIPLLIVTANIAVKHNLTYLKRTMLSDLMLVGKIMLVTIPPSLFVYQQPDTGMVFLYLASVSSIIFLSGINKKLIVTIIIVPSILVSGLVYIYFQHPDILFKDLIPMLKPHQQERVIGWLKPDQNPNQGYQTKKAILAVGSGELQGKGIGHGDVYIPEKHTDFIFATVAEEGGFVTASLVICLFFLLMYRLIIIGDKTSDPFGTYFCIGIVAELSLQIFQNIGMMVGVMPVKGISLPFLTYGGSSLFSNMLLFGVALSIHKMYGKYMFEMKN